MNITQRLADLARHLPYRGPREVCLDAAKEINRLEADNERLTRIVAPLTRRTGQYEARIAELVAEVERLRQGATEQAVS